MALILVHNNLKIRFHVNRISKLNPRHFMGEYQSDGKSGQEKRAESIHSLINCLEDVLKKL